MSVQNVIDALSKVKDKSKPCCVWINSCIPEVTYEGGSRIPIVYVDDLEDFGCTDMCCEYIWDGEEDDDEEVASEEGDEEENEDAQ